MTSDHYQICNRCIMDTSDPTITFDELGNCNHCNSAVELGERTWFPNEYGEKQLNEIFEKIKREEKNKEFDCIVGLSGGVDSSYLSWLIVNRGLRPLVVHVDCGWNSEQSVRNIENIVKKLNIELHTIVINWEEMKDLQKSFFKASLPEQDIPQDHAIFAAFYKFAHKNKIKYVMNGYNFATESIMPSSWGFNAMDYRHIKAIHKRFGEIKLIDFPFVNFFQRYIYYPHIKKMTIVNPLNYINYRKEEAIEFMKENLGWEYYGGKHYESRFTKFYQSYYLPTKFKFDKRRGHLSSLIMSRQLTRDQALNTMKESVYSESEIEYDLEYIAKKLDWTPQEFKDIINQPPKRHQDFPTNEFIFSFGLKLKNYISRILANKQ
ncbi:MAG: N-acetyl sugar amidotransferase [Tenuifilaceae bacterium]